MGYSDYELLILNYFDDDVAQSSVDDINLFVASTIAWLSIGSRTAEPSAAALAILDKISNTLEALVERNGRKNCSGCMNSDSDWLEALSYDFRWRHGQFWNLYGRAARRIFHHFETLYSQGVLTGDAKDIAANLHICLERSHEHAEVCDTEGCRWMSHACRGWAACELLDVRVHGDDASSTDTSFSGKLEKRVSVKELFVVDSDSSTQDDDVYR